MKIFPNAAASMVFRILLFAAAVSLAAYIPYKYATQLHAIHGLYALLFPLSGVLAAAGIVLALRPRAVCECSTGVRVGAAALAGLWMVTGVLGVPSLMESVARSPAGGLFATFHMLAQHVFLSLTIIAFAFAPQAMVRKLGVSAPVRIAQTARATA